MITSGYLQYVKLYLSVVTDAYIDAAQLIAMC